MELQRCCRRFFTLVLYLHTSYTLSRSLSALITAINTDSWCHHACACPPVQGPSKTRRRGSTSAVQKKVNKQITQEAGVGFAARIAETIHNCGSGCGALTTLVIAPQCAKASRNMVSVTKFASVGRFEMKTDFPLLAVEGARRGGALRLISTGLMEKEAV